MTVHEVVPDRVPSPRRGVELAGVLLFPDVPPARLGAPPPSSPPAQSGPLMHRQARSTPVSAPPLSEADVRGGPRQACPLAIGVLSALVLAVPFWAVVIAWLT
jgi:hypothetical protein